MPDMFAYRYRQLDIALGSTLTDFEYPVQGERIYYEGPSDGPELTVRLQALHNDAIRIRPQGEIIGPFTRLYISGAVSGLTPRLIVSSPKDISFLSRDVNVGTINTLQTITNPVPVSTVAAVTSITNPVVAKDFILDRAVAGFIFERGETFTAAAGVSNHHQIFNPVGSGKTVVVTDLILAASATANCEYLQYNTALATLTGNFYNASNGGSNSSAELRKVQSASLIGTNMLAVIPLVSGVVQVKRFDVLSAGEGIVFRCPPVNTTSYFSARIWEF